MDCTQMDRYLDMMLDGTLDGDDLHAVEDHCQTCAECARKLEANRLMMRAFEDMPPELDVPLDTQAAWRNAVKREASAAKRRRSYRWVGGIAAVLAVAAVASFALKAPTRSAPVEQGMMVTAEYSADAAFIETDGAAGRNDAGVEEALEEAFEEEASAPMLDKAASAPMHEIDMVVEDVERACLYAQDLAQEYEGAIDIQRYDLDGVSCANLYIELPAANCAEYVEAMGHFDRSGTTIDPAAFDGESSILLVLKSE